MSEQFDKRHKAFEWLRSIALDESASPEAQASAAVALAEWHKLKTSASSAERQEDEPLTRYRPTVHATMLEDSAGEYVRVADVHVAMGKAFDIGKASASNAALPTNLKEALEAGGKIVPGGITIRDAPSSHVEPSAELAAALDRERGNSDLYNHELARSSTAPNEIEEALWALHSYESNRDDGGRVYSEADITRMVEAVRSVPSATLPPSQHRYAAPFKMMGKETEWVQVRFVSHQHIKDKPTEANPTPVRVIVVGDLERAQPHALRNGPMAPSDGRAKGE